MDTDNDRSIFFLFIHIQMYSLNNYINTYKVEIKSMKTGTHKNISRYKTAWYIYETTE